MLLHLSGGGDRFFDAGEVDRLRDVPPTDYLLRATADDPGQTVTLSGTSVRRLVSSAYPIDQIGFVRFVRADGTWSTLSAGDLADPPPFADGRFPLVFVDSVGTRYFKPVRGDRDANARDNLSTRSEEPLEGWVQTGRVLTVTASGDPTDIDPGDRVSFHANVTGARDGEQLTIRWTFGDGARATGDSVRHTYDATGAYDALATVTGSRDSGGTSDLVRVNVGDAKGAPKNGAPKGQPVPTAPRGGPSKGNPDARPGSTAANGSTDGAATTQEPAPAAVAGRQAGGGARFSGQGEAEARPAGARHPGGQGRERPPARGQRRAAQRDEDPARAARALGRAARRRASVRAAGGRDRPPLADGAGGVARGGLHPRETRHVTDQIEQVIFDVA